MNNATPMLEIKGVSKYFGSTVANKDINLTVNKGEILALLGENGSGKTTLMNMISGIYYPDEGHIYINGEEAHIASPQDAFGYKIGMIHQHFKLVECFSVLDNIILGVEPNKMGFLQKAEARKKVVALSEKYGLRVDPDALISDISVGMQQRVEILKMLYRDNEILIFDEATSMLDPKGRREVLAEMKKLRDCGKTVVMITHDVEEAVLADQVILMGRPNGQKDPNTVLAQGSVREILTDSRLLIQAGIVPPMAVRMYEDLKLAGIELNRCPLTKEELAEALCRWKSEN